MPAHAERDTCALHAHERFGKWPPLVNKVLTFCHRGARVLAPQWPAAAEFHDAFARAHNTRRWQVGMHPVTRDALGQALVSHRRRQDIDTRRLDGVMRSAAHAMISDRVEDLPFRGGRSLCEHALSPQLWDDGWNACATGKRFKGLFDREIATSVSSQRVVPVAPDDLQAQSLRRGYDLLARVAPDLCDSVLRHVRVIAVIDYENAEQRKGRIRADLCQNVSTHAVPGTIFLSPSPLRTPLHTAEALLHEAAHKKLSDLVLTGTIFRDGYDPDGAPTIRSIWNRSLSWNASEWSVDRALFAYHVYVYLSRFFDFARRWIDDLSADYDGISAAGLEGQFKGALNRAEYLRREIRRRGMGELGADGVDLMGWLDDEFERLLPKGGISPPDMALLLDRYDRETREISRTIRGLSDTGADEGDWSPLATYENWPIRRTVSHLVHSEIVAAFRVLSTIGESAPPCFAFYDGDRWSAVARTTMSLEALATALHSVRTFTSCTLRSANPEAIHASWRMDRSGTLLDLVADMVNHASRHLGQLSAS